MAKASEEHRNQARSRVKNFCEDGFALYDDTKDSFDALVLLVAQALADEAERVRDEVELDCIHMWCDYCHDLDWPFREAGENEFGGPYWSHPAHRRPKRCNAARMWERRYQRAKAKEARDGEGE